MTRITGLILVGLFLSLLLNGCSEDGTGVDRPAGETISRDRTGSSPALMEALRTFKTKGLFYDGHNPAEIDGPGALNRFLERSDANAVYLTPEEFAAFQASHKANYVGVGMEIEKQESGEIVCFPIPGSPAHKAGINKGDRIEAIDGRPVAGRSMYVVASWLMGAGGTKVHLLISKKGEGNRRIEVVRERIQTRSVTVETAFGLTIVRIRYFDSGTKRQLQYAIEALKPGTRLVLDLRDNPGGDLFKSIDAAMLFLEKGALIVTIDSRQTAQPYRSTTAAEYTDAPLVIWQNENTASAAEVFIAALTQNRRSVSIGSKSYGKGTTQEITEMSDGSALVFTSGYLITPKGMRYHRRGLEPSRAVKVERPSTEAFLKETKRIFLGNR
jgi:carboxyl-terminal processing protease